jgi:hypothetical protein
LFRIYGSGIPKDEQGDDRAPVDSSSSRRAEASGKSNRSGAATSSKSRRGVNAKTPVVSASDVHLVSTVEEFRVDAIGRYGDAVFGDPFATVVVLKTGSPSETPEGNFMETPYGEALHKSLQSLGYSDEGMLGIWVGESNGRSDSLGKVAANVADPKLLRAAVELVDPTCVIALDSNAGGLFLKSYGDMLDENAPIGTRDEFAWACGRKVVLLDDFPSAVDDISAKRSAWAALREIRRSKS